MINGVTKLALTKLDVLNEFEEIKIADQYEYEGKRSTELPFCLDNTAIKPILRSHKGWNEDISTSKDIASLPENAKSYLKLLEEKLQTPIGFVSIGPERDELIVNK